MVEVLANNVDRLVSIEIRGPGVPRDIMPHLYENVRARVGQPLSLHAADLFARTLHSGDTVILMTGAGDPLWLPKGETDGPIGTAGLARALDLAFQAHLVLVCTSGYEAPIAAAVEAAGLSVLPRDMAGRRHHCAALETFPLGDLETSRNRAESLLNAYRPAMIVAVEVKGPNAHGDLAYMSGRTATGEARLDAIFDVARDCGIPTVGFGDGGNELGFGAYTEVVRAAHPHGDRIACLTPADALMVAAISNWGAYAVETVLGAVLKRPGLIHSPELEEEMLRAAVRAGAGDGIHTQQMLMVDGLPMDVHLAVVDILGHMVRTALGDVSYALS